MSVGTEGFLCSIFHKFGVNGVIFVVLLTIFEIYIRVKENIGKDVCV